MVSKKGLSLSILAILILSLISLAVVLYIVIKAGLLSALRDIVCVNVTSISSMIRGIIIDLIWWFFGGVLLIVFFILFVFGSLCKAFPIGTAICTAMYAAFAAILIIAIMDLMGMIPLFTCQTSDITIGDSVHHVAAVNFEKEVAARTVDCWNMYAKGRYDPLTGLSTPNPKTCFVINFNLTSNINVSDILTYMAKNNFTKGMDYLTAAGGNPIVHINTTFSTDDASILKTKNFHEGRLFIKYGDDFLYSSWYSPDCDITGSWAPPDKTVYNSNIAFAILSPAGWTADNILRWLGHNNDYVYWCFDRKVTK